MLLNIMLPVIMHVHCSLYILIITNGNTTCGLATSLNLLLCIIILYKIFCDHLDSIDSLIDPAFSIASVCLCLSCRSAAFLQI